jgi:hypothetical protein
MVVIDPAVGLTLRLTSNLETGLRLDPTQVSALIGAGAAILGVLLGHVIVAIKEWWTARKKDQRDSAYLAILVVSHLDRFANGCTNVAHDDGTDQGQPAGHDGEFHAVTVKPPEFRPLEIEVEWKVLPKELMYEIFAIPDKREKIENQLEGIAEYDFDPPDFPEYFQTRRRAYAQLGLYVSAVARKLRKHASMPIEDPAPGEWNRDEALQELLNNLDAKRAERDKRLAESTLDLS